MFLSPFHNPTHHSRPPRDSSTSSRDQLASPRHLPGLRCTVLSRRALQHDYCTVWCQHSRSPSTFIDLLYLQLSLPYHGFGPRKRGKRRGITVGIPPTETHLQLTVDHRNEEQSFSVRMVPGQLKSSYILQVQLLKICSHSFTSW